MLTKSTRAGDGWLTTAEAAARLGVKPATLYAYVSRGLLERVTADDGRGSRFDPEAIEAFRTGRRRPVVGELDTVVATALTHVADGSLNVRGRDLVAMVDRGAGYEAVVAWLWDEDPSSAHASPAPSDGVADGLASAQRALPSHAPVLDRLRVTVAFVSASDPLRVDLSPLSVRRVGHVLLAAMVDGLPLVGRAPRSDRIADRLWPRLTAKRPLGPRRDALDAALALLADHGLATSTFGARIAASVRADPYSIVLTGLGVVGGRLHGGASGEVHRLLADAERLGDPTAALADAHRRGEPLPGFGHPVHTAEDPRHTLLMRRVADAWRSDPRLALVDDVIRVIRARTEAVANVDLALGALTWLAGMAPDAGETVFAVARTAGWIAHGLEELGEPPLRFRPRARYTGPRTA